MSQLTLFFWLCFIEAAGVVVDWIIIFLVYRAGSGYQLKTCI